MYLRSLVLISFLLSYSPSLWPDDCAKLLSTAFSEADVQAWKHTLSAFLRHHIVRRQIAEQPRGPQGDHRVYIPKPVEVEPASNDISPADVKILPAEPGHERAVFHLGSFSVTCEIQSGEKNGLTGVSLTLNTQKERSDPQVSGRPLTVEINDPFLAVDIMQILRNISEQKKLARQQRRRVNADSLISALRQVNDLINGQPVPPQRKFYSLTDWLRGEVESASRHLVGSFNDAVFEVGLTNMNDTVLLNIKPHYLHGSSTGSELFNNIVKETIGRIQTIADREGRSIEVKVRLEDGIFLESDNTRSEAQVVAGFKDALRFLNLHQKELEPDWKLTIHPQQIAKTQSALPPE